MEELEHAQTILKSEDLRKLKKITGEATTKRALSVAVSHTIQTYVNYHPTK